MNISEIENWLRETDLNWLDTLWRQADAVREKYVGRAVHLRGLCEISNTCIRSCRYCGLRKKNTRLQRYSMTEDEIMDCAQQAVSCGFGTLVMQGGEDYGITQDAMSAVIRRIKQETPLAVTLSLGERPEADLAAWKEAGADRYLLRFETSDNELYEAIHPSLPNKKSDRIAILHQLKSLGYETGSGVMIGIPGQTYTSLARDIHLFQELDLDMIGVGPFIPHPRTPLSGIESPLPPDEQVPNTETTVFNVLALTRLVCPESNIPSTTALATIDKQSGYEEGLARGANVIMPNVTPPAYKKLYEIYPAKACVDESPEHVSNLIQQRILATGRTIGTGPGPRLRTKPPSPPADNAL